MSDILHRVGIKATPEEVFAALTTVEGLAGWWVGDTEGDVDPDGGLARFRFSGPPEAGGFLIEVLESERPTSVLWEVVHGPDEWVGTKMRFALKVEDGLTIVVFGHLDWRDAGEFMSHCSTKWALFLMSLKKLLETGTGEPTPHDVQNDNWS